MSYLILNEIGNSEKGQRFLNNVAMSKRQDEFIKREMSNREQQNADRVALEKRYNIDSRNDTVAKDAHVGRDFLVRNGSTGGLISTRMTTDHRESFPPNHPESHQGQADKWRHSADRSRYAANKFESYADRARERHGDLDPGRKEREEKTFKPWQDTRVMAQHQSHLASDVGRGDFKTKRIF